jgi:hypothetical protein
MVMAEIREYKWKNSPHADIDANVVGTFLAKEAAKRGKRRLKVDEIMELARPKRSPIHKAFDWDESVAARKWNLHQARNLTNNLVCVVIQEVGARPETVQAFVSLSPIDNGRAYYDTVAVMSDREVLTHQIEQATKELCNLLARWRHLVPHSKLLGAVMRTFERSTGVRARRPSAEEDRPQPNL